ncbi:MAG: hypothetical protein ACOYLB_02255 [Phototrophicaceae bacterium]
MKHFLVFVLPYVFTFLFQSGSPNYIAFYVGRELDTQGGLVVSFTVTNSGTTATQPATADLRVLGEQTTLASATVPPLEASASQLVKLTIPLTLLPPNVVQPYELTLTSPEMQPIKAGASFAVPFVAGELNPTPQTTPVPSSTSIPTTSIPTNPVLGMATNWVETLRGVLNDLLASLGVSVELSLTTVWGGLLILVSVLGVLLWLFTVIVRLLFSAPVTLGVKLPPYMDMPPHSADTLSGRRQMWQPTATHGALVGQQIEGTLVARKLLLGLENRPFNDWKLSALGLSQYDDYGRVSRSQVIAPQSLLKKLNHLLKHAHKLDKKTLQRRIAPVSQALTRGLIGKLPARTNTLPIALDLYFQGAHGEVRIIFELYQFQVGEWVLLDRWNPEMTVTGKIIHEFYTYTFHGMASTENKTQFRKRLTLELAFALLQVVQTEIELTTRNNGSRDTQEHATLDHAKMNETQPHR